MVLGARQVYNLDISRLGAYIFMSHFWRLVGDFLAYINFQSLWPLKWSTSQFNTCPNQLLLCECYAKIFTDSWLFKIILFQYAEEEPKETTPTRDSTVSIKTELVDDSEASTPNSPITPREDSELKPVLNTASSTTDHDIIPEVSDVVSEDTVPAPDAMCSTSTVDVDSTQFSKDLSSSLTECLVEINIAVGSGRNTPSPCPSTSGSLMLFVLNWCLPKSVIYLYVSLFSWGTLGSEQVPVISSQQIDICTCIISMHLLTILCH